jgi:hypothetical protein
MTVAHDASFEFFATAVTHSLFLYSETLKQTSCVNRNKLVSIDVGQLEAQQSILKYASASLLTSFQSSSPHSIRSHAAAYVSAS